MKCKKIRKKLVAYLDGELGEKQKLLIKRHLLECAECRKEVDLLSRTSCLLKNQPRIKSSLDFDVNLWRKINSLEKREITPHPLKRVAYIILPAAVAAALIIGVFMGNLVEKLTPSQNVNTPNLEEEYLSSIGLDSFEDFPPGSLPQAYFSLTNQTG